MDLGGCEVRSADIGSVLNPSIPSGCPEPVDNVDHFVRLKFMFAEKEE
jgi:hypothetical protein